MSWPLHLAGVPPAGREALAQAAEGVRRERREGGQRIDVEVSRVLASDGPHHVLELVALPARAHELAFGRIELRALDLFHGAASGEVLGVDEERRLLFVRFHEGEPRPGACCVHPFDYIESLRTFYELAGTSERLRPTAERALAAALGALPRSVPATGTAFDRLWAQRWAVIWGPPGTGKTTTLARELAARVHDGRTLFVSTTNQATDVAAQRFGAHLRDRGEDIALGRRVGSGARVRGFVDQGLEAMLPGGAHDARHTLAQLELELAAERDPALLNALHARAHGLRSGLSATARDFDDETAHVVFATVHSAAKLVAKRERDAERQQRATPAEPPFDTLVVDEAGMVPRVTVAMLSSLARRRVLLAGDPRQLAPISRAERVFAASVKRFIAQSAIDGLDLPDPTATEHDPALLFLDVQHRADAPIGELISRYQYEGRVTTSPALASRTPLFPGLPRTALLLLDEEPEAKRDPSRVRAERPPTGSGWQRPLGLVLLRRLFEAHPELAAGPGLFITPFVAQLEQLARFVDELGLAGRYRASTVHAQQGNEADVVVFDPVHASSTAWDEIEWRRLVNVALSRARRCALVLVSRDELRQPFLAPLLELMPPHRLVKGRLVPLELDALAPSSLARERPRRALRAAEPTARYVATPPSSSGYRLGDQIGMRRRLRPVLGLEQDRLRRMRLDEGPRLVRGVAGSGKTLIAVRWAIRSLAEAPSDARLLFVYGNRALAPLLSRSLAEAAAEEGLTFPDERLVLRHAGDVLAEHAPALDAKPWEYERLAHALEARAFEPTYDALFIDEAQDFGEAALRQLFRVVRDHLDPSGVQRKALRIFYDDAQQVYGRGRPSWAKLGVDLRGRSVVMRESFRSTRAIGELAMNVLAIVEGKLGDGLAELVEDQLVVIDEHDGGHVLRSLHHLFDGSSPSLRVAESREAEWDWVTDTVRRSLVEQVVHPADIKVLAMGDHVRAELQARLARALEGIAPVDVVTRGHAPSDTTCAIEILTPHAMKGYEAELVFVVAADTFSAKGAPLPRVLYTAMTRARALLFVSGTRGASAAAGDAILDALEAGRRRLARRGSADET